MKKLNLGLSLLAALFVVFSFNSCTDEINCNEGPASQVEASVLEAEIEEIENYLEAQNLDYMTDPSGVRYIELEAGTGGSPNFCSSVFVDYEGRILGDDEIFDSRIGYQLNLRQDNVLPGLKYAVTNMNRNAVHRVFIPPSLLTIRGISNVNPNNVPVGSPVEFKIRLTSN